MSVSHGLGKDSDVLAVLVTGGLGRQPVDAGQSFECIGQGGVAFGGSANVSGPAAEVSARGGAGSDSGRWVPLLGFPASYSAVGSGSIHASGAASSSLSLSRVGHGGIEASGAAHCEIDRTRAIAKMVDEDFLMLAA